MWVRIFDKYAISKSGTVRNIKSGRQIKQFQGKDGYMRVQIGGKTRTVHRLVALAFIPAEVGKNFINHKDGNKQNNFADNLEWCTRSENMRHAYNIGLKSSCGAKNGRNKLTENDVMYIRKHYIRGDALFGATALAEKFGVARQTITAVATGQNWSASLPNSEIITGE